MSTAALVKRFINEVWNQGHMHVIAEVMQAPYHARSFNYGFPQHPPLSHAQMEQHVREFRGGFPDFHMEIEELFEVEDRAYVQTRLRGTHRGAFMGLPPTGRTVELVLCAVYRSREGKLVGHSVLVDLLGMLQQIGLAPGAPPPGAPPNAAPPSGALQ